MYTENLLLTIHSYITIHSKSNDPWKHKNNTYCSMINRTYIYTHGNYIRLHSEINFIKKIAIENGYNEKYIHKLHRKYNKKTNIIKKTT